MNAGETEQTQTYVHPDFVEVEHEFSRNLAHRGDVGAAFAAYVDGELVADLWGGMADRRSMRRWRKDTIAGIFSGTKGLVAACMLMLIERGQLELSEPVARYWPEFAAGNKQDILVEHVLSHQACVPGIEKPVSVEEACDAGRMAELLAAQPALGEPASRFYYHALTFGWLCGELVRRVDGRTIGQFFKAEIATPLRLDAWIGLPESEEPRVAYLETDAPIVGAADERPAYDRIGWSIWENPPRFSEHALAANTRIWRAAEVPGSNGVATARSLARFYGDLVGDRPAGLLSPELLADATRCRVEAVDPYLDEPLAFGLGFALQSTLKPFGPAEHAFGHAGVGGSIHGAWPHEQVGFSYITSSLSTSDGVDGVERGAALLDALHRSIVKRELA